jgi:hypothetical protein
MSEEQNVTSGQVAGTTQGTAPAPQGAEQTSQQEAKPEFLTRAEAEALKAEILNQARSYADKGRVRVEKSVQAVTNSIAQMRSLGKEITPAEEKQLIATATQKAMTEPDPEPAGTSPQGEPQVQIDPRIMAFQQAAGVELYDGDPELTTLDRSHTEKEFFVSLQKALTAKATRLAASPNEPEPSNPAARLPASGTAVNGLPLEMSARDAWDRVEHKK